MTWWIKENHLLGSKNPTDAVLAQLKSEGFRVLISLLELAEQAPNYCVATVKQAGWIYYEIPIKDFQAPRLSQVHDFIDITKRHLNDKLLLHCQEGQGRTGTLAAAYWLGQGLSAAAAIQEVRKVNPKAVESKAQEAILYQAEKDVMLLHE